MQPLAPAGRQGGPHVVARTSALILAIALAAHSTVSAAGTDVAASSQFPIPDWAIALILIGSAAIIAAVVVPIACCCSCGMSDDPAPQLELQYPVRSKDSPIPSRGEAGSGLAGGRGVESGRGRNPFETRSTASDGAPQGRHDSGVLVYVQDSSDDGQSNKLSRQTGNSENPFCFESFREKEEARLQKVPDLSRSQVQRLRRLSARETADPEFGPFMD